MNYSIKTIELMDIQNNTIEEELNFDQTCPETYVNYFGFYFKKSTLNCLNNEKKKRKREWN